MPNAESINAERVNVECVNDECVTVDEVMRLCHVTTYAPSYLQRFYDETPDLAGAPYAAQQERLLARRFSWSDFFVTYVRERGGDGMAIVANHARAQARWAKEHGLASAERDAVLLHQIETCAPDVLFFEDSFSFPAALLREARQRVPGLRVVLGWVGVVSRTTPLARDLDFVVTSAPALDAAAVAAGAKTMTMLHGFEPCVLDEAPEAGSRFPVTFVGSIAAGIHEDRRQVLEAAARRAPLVVFSDSLRPSAGESLRNLAVAAARRRLPSYLRLMTSSLRRHAQPAAYGLEMYSVLRASDVSINFQGWGVDYFVPNMRLFETTGMGACMVTDAKPGLDQLFDLEREIVTYRNPEECAEKVRWLLDHPAERAAIGAAGQRRTLKDHTLRDRVNGLVAQIESRW